MSRQRDEMRRANALVPTVIIALLLGAPLYAASNISYRVEFVNGFGCHVVQVNLNSPRVKVTPIVTLRFPGGAEPMLQMCRRERPVAAVTGTFFSKTTLLPVGDIVIDGRLVHFGGMGSAIAITGDNRVVIERLPYGRTQDWSPFESVLACGPMLLEAGVIALAPRHERFQDPHVLGRASRTAVGLTAANKLLMVVTREQVNLWELAKIMQGLGCIDAINLDGGSSTGMYYRGSVIVSPARPLVNMLAVYDDVPPETRVCTSGLSCDREAIYRYQMRRAYQVYLRAQVPLATGDLDEAIRLLQEAARLDHRNASYQVRLAETLLRRGDAQAAAMSFARAGVILLDKGDGEAALARFRTALAHDPNNRIALSGLLQTYRSLGREAEARRAERDMLLRELADDMVVAHGELMTELAERAFALVGKSVPAELPGPKLAGAMGETMWVDGALGVRVAIPSSWEFVREGDDSVLWMRHREQAMLACLRAVYVPAQLGLERLVDLYWEGTFRTELYQAPVVRGAGTEPIWRTETVLTGRGGYGETVFVLRDDVLWVLGMRSTESLRTDAMSDFGYIARELSFF